jgi:hypothetical protein
MTAPTNGGIFGLTRMTSKPDVIINDTESQMVISVSEYCVAAMYSGPDV